MTSVMLLVCLVTAVASSTFAAHNAGNGRWAWAGFWFGLFVLNAGKAFLL